jgi:acyl-CoA hydrolase
MSFDSHYSQKRMSAHDAVKLVRDGEHVVLPTGAGEPMALLSALSERRREFHDVKVAQLLQFRPFDYIDPATVENVRHVGYFIGNCTRQGAQAGWVDVLPCHFSEVPMLLRRRLIPADVVFTVASPMDKHGYFSLSMSPDYIMAAMEVARAIVIETTPHCPVAFGNCRVHISQITAVVESENPMVELPSPPIGPVEIAIGQHVAELIPDGATLQIGWGGIPNAVASLMTHKKDLGIHSEMLGDAIVPLVKAGVINGSRKNINRGKIIGTFAGGSKVLYDFMHLNPALEMHPVDYTNSPHLAGQNDNLISINATLQVDLIGQCGSESLGHKPYSGTGGQADFVRAANISNGGKAILVLSSTAKDETISRIAPVLSPGTHVSTHKNDVNYVVTEFGVATLRGKTTRERAKELIAIAHPKFRDELTSQARAMHLL